MNTPLPIYRTGEGPTLLFIHTLGSSADVWHDIVKILRHRYHCCTLDLFGHGTNRPGQESSTIESTAGALAESLSDVKWKPTAIVGHNLGGLIAISMMRQIPLCADRLILLDTPTSQAKNAFLRKMVRSTLSRHFEQSVRKQLGRMVKDEEVYKELVEKALSTDRQTYLSYMDSMMRTDFRSDIPQIEVPVDAWITRSLAPDKPAFEKVIEQYGFGQLPPHNRHHDPQSGHFAMLENPASFAASLERIVRGG